MSRIWDSIRKLVGGGHADSERASEIYALADEGFAVRPNTASFDFDLPEAAAPIAALPRDGYFPDLAVAYHDPAGQVAEEYRALRTNLLASHPDGNVSCIVTSARSGEGKTVTCMNLAMVMAERENTQTVLVDCNLREARLSSMMRMSSGPGVANLLRGEATLQEAIQPTTYPSLFCISAGENYRNFSLLLATQPLSDLIAGLRKHFNHVIIDTPAINVATDAAVVGSVVREALLVVRMYKTPRESVDRAIRQLRASHVGVSGLVLTDRRFFIPDALYRWL